MRQLLLLAALIGFAAASGAEVIRCTDAEGRVSYTDTRCPPGARQTGQVAEPAPAAPGSESAGRAWQPPPEPASPAAPPQQQQSPGPVIIDGRGHPEQPAGDPRWSERGDDPFYVDSGEPYPGVYRPQRPPRDMRPRLRDCDASGCRDTQGNHYDRSGRLDRYQRPDGKTCRPVGTTVVCR